MGSVFLSHSHADKGFVRKLAADLVTAGVAVWIDEAEIKIGDSLIRKIEEAISSVEYVAACLSQNSVKSNWVRKELDIAITQEIKGKRVVVLPLLLNGLEDCEIPPFLSDKCYADFRHPAHYDAEFSKLLACVQPDAELDLNRGATIDAERSERLVETAIKVGMRNRVVDHLVEVLPERVDATERYWIYIALGKIGGSKAKFAIKKGLAEENEFALNGAKTAWELVRHRSAHSA